MRPRWGTTAHVRRTYSTLVGGFDSRTWHSGTKVIAPVLICEHGAMRIAREYQIELKPGRRKLQPDRKRIDVTNEMRERHAQLAD